MAYISFQPKDYFNTVLYTGNGTSQSITGVGFQPDLVWNKRRTGANEHALTDAVRGTTKTLFSSLTNAETTQSGGLTSFDSDGYSVGNSGEFNDNLESYVGWNWLANGSGSADTDGTISSTVSANDTAGFSIVKYTGTGSAGNVGHGLSTAPKVLINKALGVQDWFVGHSSIGFTKFLKLNATNAESTNSGIWNDTAPTTDHFTINSANGNTNATGVDYITYCFAEKKGFSKFGSYTGNGNADGTFVYTGFKPAFLLSKMSSGTQGWFLVDNKRANPFNPIDGSLHPNSNAAEDTASDFFVDFTSNGFKLRDNDAQLNGSGSTYIFMAFAEHPLVSSNDIPAVAR